MELDTDLVAARDYPDLSIDGYHERPELGSTGVRIFAREGPWSFLAKQTKVVRHAMEHLGFKLRQEITEIPDTPSDAKRLGRAFHLAMEHSVESLSQWVEIIPTRVEDDEWLEEVLANTPDKSKAERPEPGVEIQSNKKLHRYYLNLRKAAADRSGRDWMTEEEFNALRGQVESVFETPAAMEYLTQIADAQLEQVCVGLCTNTGIPVKAMTDFALPHIATLIDYKTTKATTTNEFVRDALKKYSYGHQGEWYLRVFGFQHFKIISVRNEPPWEAMVYDLPKELIAGRRNRFGFQEEGYRAANSFHLTAIQNCLITDSWHSMMWGSEIPLDPDERMPQ